jgi:hypothetical protein
LWLCESIRGRFVGRPCAASSAASLVPSRYSNSRTETSGLDSPTIYDFDTERKRICASYLFSAHKQSTKKVCTHYSHMRINRAAPVPRLRCRPTTNADSFSDQCPAVNSPSSRTRGIPHRSPPNVKYARSRQISTSEPWPLNDASLYALAGVRKPFLSALLLAGTRQS